jgi:hypothetical protein
LRGIRFQFVSVPLQVSEIVERIGAAEFGRVDQAHEQVADFRAIFGEIKQTVLPTMETFP